MIKAMDKGKKFISVERRGQQSSPRVERRTASSAHAPVQMRNNRASAAERNLKIAHRRSTGMSQPSTDRIGMLVMEANEISQYLRKDYEFIRKDNPVIDENDTQIKVTNLKYHISTIWTLTKLKERLVRMRKLMYAGEAESAGMSGESVFFDPDDKWTKEESLTEYPLFNGDPHAATLSTDTVVRRRKPNDRGERPRPVRPISMPPDLIASPLSAGGLNGHTSFSSSSSSELPAESEFLQMSGTLGDTPSSVDVEKTSLQRASPSQRTSSPQTPSPSGCSGTQEKYLTGNNASRDDDIPNYHHRPTGTVTPIRDITSSNSEYGNSKLSNNAAKVKPTAAKSKKVVTHHAGTQTETEKTASPKVTPMLTLCKEMANIMLGRLTGSKVSPNVVDHILCSCESVKVAVVNILEAYTQAQVSPTLLTENFGDTELVRICCMQLVSGMDLLLSHTCLWAQSFSQLNSALISDLSNNITSIVKELATEMVTFLQGCENDRENLAQDSSLKIIEHLYELVKLCGQLALANNLCPATALSDPERESLDDLMTLRTSKPHDQNKIQPSEDMKQALLGGCNVFLEQSIQGGLQTIHECEESAQSLNDMCHNRGSETQREVLRHVYIVIATSKLLVLKCQQTQVELDSIMKEEGGKPDNYFVQYFHRNAALVGQVNSFVDSITLLEQAAEPLTSDEEAGSLRKVFRCSEMVQRAATKLVLASALQLTADSSLICSNGISVSPISGVSPELSSIGTDSGAFSAQTKELDASSQDVNLSTQALCDIVRKRLPLCVDNNAKVKRMLPATPGRGLVRCQSARTSERKRISGSFGVGSSFDRQ